MDEMDDTTKKKIELQLPSRLGFEKVAMNTAASVARMMGFGEERVEDHQDRDCGGLHQCHGARQQAG